VITYGLKGRISLNGWQLLQASVFVVLNGVVGCLAGSTNRMRRKFNQHLGELRASLDRASLMDQDKAPPKVAKRAMGIAERVSLVMGAALMCGYTVAGIYATVMSRVALREFAMAAQKEPRSNGASGTPAGVQPKVDFSLWSMKRITAYEKSLKRQFAPPLAVLQIPKIGLEVPVFNGRDDLTLNREAERIIGTAQFGHGGNVGIGGHRDSFFRVSTMRSWETESN
jgi:hypothetical protein